nr:DUF4123 domain-containing protein [Niabella beijingensis]
MLCYDTALNGEYTLIRLLQRYPRYRSLFYQTDDERIWDAAPYLFEMDKEVYSLREKNALVRLNHCIFFETQESTEAVVAFLQSLFYKEQEARPVYVRIWDARVLLSGFGGWSRKEQLAFFDCFDCFYTEHEDRGYLNRWLPGRNNELRSERIPASAISYGTAETGQLPAAAAPGNIPEDTTRPETGAQQEEAPKRRRFFIE